MPRHAFHCAHFSGSTRVKVLPLPYSLFSSILPPSASASFWLKCRPSPVPSWACPVLEVTWLNAVNSFAWSSGRIPRPVSATLISTLISSVRLPLSSRRSALSRTLPRSVYLIALLVRLMTIWLNARRSVRTVSQIVINLTNNAIKFTERGSVRLKAERREESGSRTLEINVEISVADTGLGIRPEDQAKLFTAFSQVTSRTEQAQEGTGLGLHLSQKLAEALGGRIELKSEYGRGSTFTLVLPEK